jgi:Arc/MetJ-type ribon-helix-helix transcriptional regulator
MKKVRRILRMPRENLSVSLPSKMRSLVDREAKWGERSRSAVVREALQVYFRLRQIRAEEATPLERGAVTKGRRAYKQNEFVSLEAWQHAVGFSDR